MNTEVSQVASSLSSVLIIGGDSGIGQALFPQLVQSGSTVWKTSRRQGRLSANTIHLDLSDDNLLQALPDIHFTSVVFCAAVTSIAACEAEPERTRQVNVHNAVGLARYFAQRGTQIVFLSTNLVIDGEIPFAPRHAPINPRTEYGRQKAEAEQQIMTSCAKGATIRLGKVITPKFPLFLQWQRDLRDGNVIQPFNDMVFAPVSMDYVTGLLCRVIMEQRTGIIHATGPEDITYAQAAYFMAGKLGLDSKLIQPVSCRSLLGFSHAPRHAALGEVIDGDELGTRGLEAIAPKYCLW